MSGLSDELRWRTTEPPHLPTPQELEWYTFRHAHFKTSHLYGTHAPAIFGPFVPDTKALIPGAWHFSQKNGWDSWFNFALRSDGGFYVLTPACRRSGEQGDAIKGYETLAHSTGGTEWGETFEFTVHWQDGSVGTYACTMRNGVLDGDVVDANHTDHKVHFSASRMGPPSKLVPGGWPAGAAPLLEPWIDVRWTLTDSPWSFAVRVTGTNFGSKENVTVWYLNSSGGNTGHWSSELVQADTTGAFEWTSPIDEFLGTPTDTVRYRAQGEQSGNSGQVLLPGA